MVSEIIDKILFSPFQTDKISMKIFFLQTVLTNIKINNYQARRTKQIKKALLVINLFQMVSEIIDKILFFPFQTDKISMKIFFFPDSSYKYKNK